MRNGSLDRGIEFLSEFPSPKLGFIVPGQSENGDREGEVENLKIEESKSNPPNHVQETSDCKISHFSDYH